MDPLSVTASIVGILASAGKLSELLRSIISTAKDAPRVVAALVCEINEVQAALSSLQTLLTDLSSAPPRRAALIQLDQLIVTLTESVLTFSELEAIITPLAVSKGQKFPLRTRLKWTRIEEASRSQESLESLVEQLLKSNQELCKRLKNLEDAFDARSTITKKFNDLSLVSREDNETITAARPSNNKRTSIIEVVRVRFAFDADLESSRVYRMARNDCCDRSFVSSAIRTNAWSTFSGISLADISVISIVALPLYPGDIMNEEHYLFGDTKVPQLSEPAALWTNSQSVVEIESPQPKGALSATPTRLRERAEHAREEDTPTTPRQLQDAGALVPSISLDMGGAVPSFQDKIHSALLQGDSSDQPASSPSGMQTDAAPEKELWTNGPAYLDFDGAETASSIRIHKDDASSPFDDDRHSDNDVVYPCKGCGEILGEGKAFEMGGSRWHLGCFRCNACGTLLDSDSYLQLFADGSPICSNCTYARDACDNKIEELAILLGTRHIVQTASNAGTAPGKSRICVTLVHFWASSAWPVMNRSWHDAARSREKNKTVQSLI